MTVAPVVPFGTGMAQVAEAMKAKRTGIENFMLSFRRGLIPIVLGR